MRKWSDPNISHCAVLIKMSHWARLMRQFGRALKQPLRLPFYGPFKTWMILHLTTKLRLRSKYSDSTFWYMTIYSKLTNYREDIRLLSSIYRWCFTVFIKPKPRRPENTSINMSVSTKCSNMIEILYQICNFFLCHSFQS